MAIRSMMYGTHSYDHRLVDGELGGKFLASIHRNLRKWTLKASLTRNELLKKGFVKAFFY